MSADRGTLRYARNLDRVRHRRWPTARLIFLKFADAHDYVVHKEITSGWFAEFKKLREQGANTGEPIYLVIEVADIPGNDIFSDIMTMELRVTVEGDVFTINKDRITPPGASPRFIRLEVFERTGDTFQAPALP